MEDNSEFKLRYYEGHKGHYGHEFLEFEFSENGKLRYANNSQYKREKMIRKEAFLSPAVIAEAKKIVTDSKILKANDDKWPRPSPIGKQELEVVCGGDSVFFCTDKISTSAEALRSADPEGLGTLYFLVQDLKAFVFSLIRLHFMISPI